MRVCVFCGSSEGSSSVYRKAAEDLGYALATAKVGLVYGGASIGLMGAVADAACAEGGEVIGVIPADLIKPEVAHVGIQDLRIVQTLHQRKALMAELSDAFVALPGGVGTLEEIFEVWSWACLGQHSKPCFFLNAGGFYSGLFAFLSHVVGEGFLLPQHHRLLLVVSDSGKIVDALKRGDAGRPA